MTDTEEVAALARAERPKRMLVIINPVATKMSDRLKSLVVYALQGRYEVTAVDTQAKGHAIELCREAAAAHYDVVVAFGGDGTVNEAANGLAGSRTALTCLPGGSNNVVAKLLGSPPMSWTPRSTCCTSLTPGSRAPSTSGSSTAAISRLRRGWGSTRASSSAWTATPC